MLEYDWSNTDCIQCAIVAALLKATVIMLTFIDELTIALNEECGVLLHDTM